MQAATKKSLHELQQIIARLPLEVCYVHALPEFGVGWRQVSRAVRANRLPVAPVSVARVLCRHAARTLPQEDIDEIVSRLRLILVASQERKWHVIDLLEPTQEEASPALLVRDLPARVVAALVGRGRCGVPEVDTVLIGDLLFVCARLRGRRGALYVATPPGQPVALVSSTASGLLKACVRGLGYKRFEDAQLYGHDVASLLRIHNRQHDEVAGNLANAPEYRPVPVVTHNGIDFTHQAYDEEFVNQQLGPQPPLLTELVISSTKPFFDPGRLSKPISLTVRLKSDDVANSLRCWVKKGVLSPTSDFFQIFHKVKSNKITFQEEE